MIIPESAHIVIDTLMKNGYNAKVVGGYIRNMVMDIAPNDCDIVTSATPDEIVKLFNVAYHVPNFGTEYGTVTVIIDGTPIEITSYRGSDLFEDLRRRDFTMNTLIYDEHFGIIDFLGTAIQDIQNKVIRCCGNPDDRFNEDPVRIIRAIRFSIQFGFRIDEQTLVSMKKLSNLIDEVPGERIRPELLKSLKYSENFGKYFIDKPNTLCKIFNCMSNTYDYDQNNPYHVYPLYQHMIHTFENVGTDDYITKLAALLHDVGKIFSRTTDVHNISHYYGHAEISAQLIDDDLIRLRFSNHDIKKIKELIRYHDARIVANKPSIARWLNKIGEEQFRRLLELRKADIKAQHPDSIQERINKVNAIENLLEDVIKDNAIFKISDLDINGYDILKFFNLSPSPIVGKYLKIALNAVIDEVIPNEKDKILEYLKSNLMS